MVRQSDCVIINVNCSYCKNPIHDNAIECEWCGNKVSKNYDPEQKNDIPELSIHDVEILKLLRQGAFLNAVKYKKDNSNLDLKASKEYIDNLALKHGITKPKSGCFIATVCYGDYESAEVIEFRRYRDEVLLKSAFGRIFVSSYYKVSPAIAKLLEKSESSQRMVRFIILTPLLNLIKSESKDNNTAS